MGMSRICFVILYAVHDAYKGYGNDSYSFLFSDSKIGNAKWIVNSSVKSIPVEDDVSMDSFFEEICLSPGIQ